MGCGCGAYLVSIRAQRHAKRPSKTKIGELEIALTIDEQILWFQIAVQHAVAVAEFHPGDELAHEPLDHVALHAHGRQPRIRAVRQRLPSATLVGGQALHVLFEVEVEVLEDEVELVTVCVHDVEQAHDVDVLHLLEEGDLADGGAGHTLVFRFESDLFECDNRVRFEVLGFVHHAIRPCCMLHPLSALHSLVCLIEVCPLKQKSPIPSPIFSSFW